MRVRIGFDMDGVLANLASAYREIEARLFGPEAVEEEVPETPNGPAEAGVPNEEVRLEPDPTVVTTADLKALQRKRDIVWHAIQTTDNFWTTLQPIEKDVVGRLHELATRHRWEVFFITQRPDTRGDTAQRQTQRWLVAHGFDLPSVIVVSGARGKVAAALELDYLVDDTAKNCVDVISDSNTRPILVLRYADEAVETNARKLGIAVVPSVARALALLAETQAVRKNPTLFERLARAAGWKE